ncbi:hypothetical protein AGMMS50212_13090 [Spirochaetia bacterium]|nr:hypothetical protein AGMMS50212_13090 [Spirochaetia bacterium]
MEVNDGNPVDENNEGGPAPLDAEIEDQNPVDAAAGAETGASGFPAIKKLFEDTPNTILEDAAYYKSLLSDGNENAPRLHNIFQKYATAKDPKDKAVFRQQMINVFWDFLGVAARSAPTKLTGPKKFLLRFAILHPNLLNADAKAFFGKLILTSDLEQPVYYLDEWFKLVGSGQIKNSSTDEVSTSRGNESAHLQALYEKAQGKMEGATGLLRSKNKEKLGLEAQIAEKLSFAVTHGTYLPFPEISACYNDAQKAAFASVGETIKQLNKIDREISIYMQDFEQATEDMESLKSKLEAAGASTMASVDIQAVDTEFGSIRQMAKMTVGRQGNAFPVLTSEFFRSSPNGVGFKENVISKLAWIESIDSEAFIRFYKNKPNRIVPFVVIIPTYGDFGMCWEPFDKANRATSRGRIAIPMYPKNLTIALLTAVADLRWQVAKEKASFYWMEEGLTGNYYQWFQNQKLKGDVRNYFIQDYILWMTKESEGTQKLDKEIRGTFWRFMPFSQPVKEKLKDRNLVYQELYQRDKNRQMSDI